MFLHMLSDKDKEKFLQIATLVSLSDNPLHWGGKTLEELTGNIALDTAAFQEIESEKAVMDSLIRECGKDSSHSRLLVGIVRFFSPVEKQFLQKLAVLPLAKMNATNERIETAFAVMKELLHDTGADLWLPSTSKIMLYELMLLALADGEISTVEGALLKHFSALQKLDDYTYDDLLERAEGMNREASKTLSLILE